MIQITLSETYQKQGWNDKKFLKQNQTKIKNHETKLPEE